ncbi:MAG: spermidine synthase [Chloroflexia bacterium]
MSASAPVTRAIESGESLWSRLRAEDRPLVGGVVARIYLTSFTLLFFELLCIRWIPSYVRYLSYFTNFILMASFLGMGVGILAARRPRFWFPPFPVMLALLVAVVMLNRFDLRISSTSVLYYGAGESQAAGAENFVVLPVIFALVAATFVPLARPLGVLFTQTNPLKAYTFDILGSLSGIAAFFAIAWFSLPPAVWFGMLAVLVVLTSGRWSAQPAGALTLAAVVAAFQMQLGAYWSPYYKIVLHPAQPSGYIVDVNNAGGHQAMIPWQAKEPFYRRVYEIFGGQTFKHALILGAGSGSDVATALAYGVSDVTAVEIDPQIQALGARFHPDKPYSDPRVRVVIDDGREFLRNTGQKYDLIIFALPDSLTLTSSVANLRLESFLLTQNALASARKALTSDGVVVLYNYYREDWFIGKLAGMVNSAFGQAPLVSTYGGWGRAAVIMDGPRLGSLPAGQFGTYHESAATNSKELRVIGEGFYPPQQNAPSPATDDWPFIYLQDKSFPSLYIAGLVAALLISVVGVGLIAPRKTLRRFDWHMFFLGVAFALLEVKALITFALLFGSTWMVNSMVFFAILTGVLLAVLVNAKFKVRRIWVFYLLLFGMLALNFVVSPDSLLFENPALRYVAASFLAFAPVFLANVIFSNSFRDSELADVAFASNLLGIMVGGMLEYFSMVLGYHLLLLPIMVFYAAALVLSRRGRSERVTA